MQTTLKYILGFIIAIALLLPILQSNFELIELKPLEAITVAQKPEFKKENYWRLNWQENYATYLNDNFGFRPWLIRFYNEFQMTLFKTTKAPGVVVGKNGELFIESYIDDYIGRNFIGNSKINEQALKLKAVQDSLKARGKDLIVVFAPGKASFYPELIPDRYLKKKKDSTNYVSFANAFKQNGINFIDMNKWFVDNKTKFKHKVYPKFGTHWNHYGMCLGLDSIIKYIEKKRNINMPDFDFSIVNYNTALKGNDFDVGILTNLLIPLDPDPNPYPIYKYKADANTVKPDVLVVGDSYWWCPVGDDLPIHFFREDEYWFYNKTQLVHNQKRKDVKLLNLSAALAQRDVVLLIATEATYYMFPYGFGDDAYKLYCNDNSKRISEIIADMKNNKSWYESIVAKAQENNIALEKQLKLDAEFILCTEIINPKETVEQIIDRIRNDVSWMKTIKKKSEDKNITIEQQIKEDAQWTFDNNK
ncbi:MAG: hypothetical protein H0U95_00050 [Bacteroidetes bacterium]|nr:hypothetical protein [Bacteroidota bacterium]